MQNKLSVIQIKKLQSFAVLCFMLVISGCTHFKAMQSASRHVAIADDVYWTLQSEVKLNQLDSKTVLLTANFQGESHQMLVTTEYQQDTLVMVAVSVQGMPLFELSLDRAGTLVSKNYLPLAVKPEYILTDIQLVHLPISMLNNHLVGAQTVEEVYQQGKQRVIAQDEQTIIHINYLQKSISFEHYQRNYQLTIEAID